MDDFLQIGKTLRQARENLNLSTEDAAHKTRIPLKIIHALESDDYSVFSSSTYARSYLSQYSQYLHLDPSHWLDAFEPAQFAHDYHSFSVIDEVEVRQASQRANPPSSSRFLPSFMGIMLAAFVLYAGYRVIENFENKEPTVDAPTQEKPQPATTAENPSPAPEPETPPRAIAVLESDDSEPAPPSVAQPVVDPAQADPTEPPKAIIIEEE